MFCGNCGKPVADNAKFCGNCGKILGENPPAAPADLIINKQGGNVQPQAPRVQQYQGQYGQSKQAPYGSPAPPTPPVPPAPPAKTTAQKRKGLKVASILITLVALVAGGLLLWFYVFNTGPLANTCWLTQDGVIISFTDDTNGYRQTEWGKESLTYKVDGESLTLTLTEDKESYHYLYRIEGDWLILEDVDSDEEITLCSSERAFICSYCDEASSDQKHTGKLDGETYYFCVDCWDEVQKFLD